MRISAIAGLALALISGSAWSADYKTLRNLQAPPAVELQPLAAGEKVQPVRFAKVVVHPRDGEAWAVVYESIPVRAEGDTRPGYRLVPWESGRIDADSASFGRPFIQSDVSVNHGNSGGPLLDEKGSVIGLTDLGLYPEESKSLNLFIPIDDALRALGLKPAA